MPHPATAGPRAADPAALPSGPEPGAALDIAAQVAAHRPMLARLARRRLRNEAWAEDAVSETVVAALERPQAFGGRANVRTWLVGILNHKLVDQVRHHTRECQLDAGDDEEPDWEGLRAAAGECETPAPSSDPLTLVARRQFVRQVDAALARLPAKQSRALVLCDWMEHETGEVCRELGVTRNHLGVMLHRARGRLRAAVAPHWSGGAALLA
jgi:RNA polymerase sigma-70 factor (ECF subfamily)